MTPNYKFLPHLAFMSAAEEQAIRAKGLLQLERGEVSPQALKLGARFISQINAAYLPAVSVRWINEEAGYGLFAEEALEEGSYVGEYTGIVRQNEKRYFAPLNNYCYLYPVLDDRGINYVIDAEQGNLTRFINHSFKPNLTPVHVFYDGFYHLIFLAAKDIEPGAQLFYSYGSSYWHLRGQPQELNG